MSDLKTVGDYRKAGLVFVEGDKTDIDGRVNKMNNVGAYNMNEGYCDDWVMSEFAWRTSTGEKPSFSGNIEVRMNNNQEVLCMQACDTTEQDAYFWMECPVSGKATHWRPHLAQSKIETPEEKEVFEQMEKKSTYDVDAHVSGEHKPVFTKEMAARGENVAAGMMFTTEKGGRYSALMVNGKSVCFKDEDGFLIGLPIGMARPIKTEREKVVEEITGEWPKACEHTIKLMYDLGYRKVDS